MTELIQTHNLDFVALAVLWTAGVLFVCRKQISKLIAEIIEENKR